MKNFLLSFGMFLFITGNIFAQLVGALQLTTSVTVATVCTAPCDGTASVKATGGQTPYTYNWSTSPTQTTATATGLCPGTYSVIVNDATPTIPNYAVATVTITCGSVSGNTINLTTSSSPASACTAPCDGVAGVNASGGQPPYTYTWSSSPVQSTQIATGLCPGSYTVLVRDAATPTPNQAVATVSVSCSGVSTGSITVTTGVTAASVCTAPCNGSATASASGGTAPYTYTWSSIPVQTGPNATGLCPGIYTVSVTDAATPNPNSAFATVTVTCSNISTGSLSVATSITPATVCTAPCNGTATANATGGTPPYFYSWSTSPVQTTQTATGLCPGSYSVNVTDSSTPSALVGKGSATIICSVANGVSMIAMNESVNLFPNPAQNELNIQFESVQEGQAHIVISNILGSEVMTLKAEVRSGQTLSVSVSELPQGIYSIGVIAGDGRMTKLFLKQ